MRGGFPANAIARGADAGGAEKVLYCASMVYNYRSVTKSLPGRFPA